MTRIRNSHEPIADCNEKTHAFVGVSDVQRLRCIQLIEFMLSTLPMIPIFTEILLTMTETVLPADSNITTKLFSCSIIEVNCRF